MGLPICSCHKCFWLIGNCFRPTVATEESNASGKAHLTEALSSKKPQELSVICQRKDSSFQNRIIVIPLPAIPGERDLWLSIHSDENAASKGDLNSRSGPGLVTASQVHPYVKSSLMNRLKLHTKSLLSHFLIAFSS